MKRQMLRLLALVLALMLTGPAQGLAKGKKGEAPKVLSYRLLDGQGNAMSAFAPGQWADVEIAAWMPYPGGQRPQGEPAVKKMKDRFKLTADTAANPAWDGQPTLRVDDWQEEGAQVIIRLPHVEYLGGKKQMKLKLAWPGQKGRALKFKVTECEKAKAAEQSQASAGQAAAIEGIEEIEEDGQREQHGVVSRPSLGESAVRAGGKKIKKWLTGESADVEVALHNKGLTGAMLAGEGLHIELLEGDFSSGGAPQAEVLSGEDQALKARITFPGLIYQGGEGRLRFSVAYGALDLPRETMTLTLKQCRGDGGAARPKAQSTPAPIEILEEEASPDAGQPTPAPAEKRDDASASSQGISSDPVSPQEEAPSPQAQPPLLRIARMPLDTVRAGQAFTLQVTVENLGGSAAAMPVASFTTSEGLALMEETASRLLPTIGPGESVTENVRLRGAAKIDQAAQSVTVEIKYQYQGGEGTASETVLVPAQTTSAPQEIAPPTARITRADMAPVGPRDRFSLVLTVKNTGSATMKGPVLALSPSDSLALEESTASLSLADLAPGASAQAVVKMRVLEEVASSAQSVGAELRYHYLTGAGEQSGSAGETIIVPMKATLKDDRAPALQIGREAFGAPVRAKEKFDLTIWFKNVSELPIQSGLVSLAVSDGLMLMEQSGTLVMPAIDPGKTWTATVRLQALKSLSAQAQGVNVEAKYSYQLSSAVREETAAAHLLVPAVVAKTRSGGGGTKTKLDPPTPNVIVSDYSFGAGQVAAGGDFELTLTFKNTSQRNKAENIVMTLETGESLSIRDSSNTFYYTGLDAGGAQTEKIRMQALPSAKAGVDKIDVSFKYEFVDSGKRSAVTAGEKLSVPIYQPDRFELTAPEQPSSAMPGEEVVLSIPFTNKGKSEVYNLTAQLEGDVSALSKRQNLGNQEPGKSGSIDFILTPEEAGEIPVNLKVSYEDANQAVVEQSYPVTLQVEDTGGEDYGDMDGDYGDWEDMDYTEEEEGSALAGTWPYLAGGGALILALAIGLGVRRKRRRRRTAQNLNFDEGEDDAS